MHLGGGVRRLRGDQGMPEYHPRFLHIRCYLFIDIYCCSQRALDVRGRRPYLPTKSKGATENEIHMISGSPLRSGSCGEKRRVRPSTQPSPCRHKTPPQTPTFWWEIKLINSPPWAIGEWCGGEEREGRCWSPRNLDVGEAMKALCI